MWAVSRDLSCQSRCFNRLKSHTVNACHTCTILGAIQPKIRCLKKFLWNTNASFLAFPCGWLMTYCWQGNCTTTAEQQHARISTWCPDPAMLKALPWTAVRLRCLFQNQLRTCRRMGTTSILCMIQPSWCQYIDIPMASRAKPDQKSTNATSTSTPIQTQRLWDLQ